MKFLYLVFLFIPILLNLASTQFIPNLPDPREDLKHPSSLQAIERIYFPHNMQPINTSEIEDVLHLFTLPSNYDIQGPKLILTQQPD